MSPALRSRMRVVGCWMIALLFVAAGSRHLRAPGSFLAIMPPNLPHPLTLIRVSGVAEILLGVGVVFPPTRRWSGIGLVLLLVAVFPANVRMATHHLPMGRLRIPDALLWLRLPLQGVLVLWVWWCTRRAPRTPPGDVLPR